MKLQKPTSNLVVSDVAASMEFYCRVLGFQRGQTVPEQAPYIFGIVTNGPVEIFFNDQKAVAEDHPALGTRAASGALALYIEVLGIEESFQTVQQHGVKITMPMKEQFYGMREFGWRIRKAGNYVCGTEGVVCSTLLPERASNEARSNAKAELKISTALFGS